MSIGIGGGPAKRLKGSGRQKTAAKAIIVAEYLEAMEFEPVKELVLLLRDPGLDKVIKMEKILELMKFVYPTVSAIQLSAVDNRSDEGQNESTNLLIEELRTMIGDKRPDIQCSGQTLPDLPLTSSPLPSDMGSLDQRSNVLNGTKPK